MTKPKTLEQLRTEKERAETQLAQEQHKLERLENRLSHAQIGAVSAPICAFYHHSLGGFSIVSAQPCPFQFHSGSKLGQRRIWNCINSVFRCFISRDVFEYAF